MTAKRSATECLEKLLGQVDHWTSQYLEETPSREELETNYLLSLFASILAYELIVFPSSYPRNTLTVDLIVLKPGSNL